MIYDNIYNCGRRADVQGREDEQVADKRIEFRNGLLSFTLPQAWVEEYDEEGATFYDDRDDSGTLRLDVATYAAPPEMDGAQVQAELLTVVAEVDADALETLPSGASLVYNVEDDVEQGHAVVVHGWYLAKRLEPDLVRLAAFSYTVAAEQTDAPLAQEELDRVEALVRNARFLPRLAEGERVED